MRRHVRYWGLRPQGGGAGPHDHGLTQCHRGLLPRCDILLDMKDEGASFSGRTRREPLSAKFQLAAEQAIYREGGGCVDTPRFLNVGSGERTWTPCSLTWAFGPRPGRAEGPLVPARRATGAEGTKARRPSVAEGTKAWRTAPRPRCRRAAAPAPGSRTARPPPGPRCSGERRGDGATSEERWMLNSAWQPIPRCSRQRLQQKPSCRHPESSEQRLDRSSLK